MSVGERAIEAAWRGDAAALRALLAEANADARDARDARHWSALHWAAERGEAECVRLLLCAGADSEARTAAGLTPLHLTTSAGISRLLVGGAGAARRSAFHAAAVGDAAALRELLR
jgi:hypothetical protein